MLAAERTSQLSSFPLPTPQMLKSDGAHRVGRSNASWILPSDPLGSVSQPGCAGAIGEWPSSVPWMQVGPGPCLSHR